MAPQPILEKLSKLIEFQKGAEKIGSLEEAANAAEKVQALLIKHNLEMADLSTFAPKDKQEIGKMQYRDIFAQKNEGKWIYSLYNVLAAHNFCKLVLSSFFDIKLRKTNQFVVLVGKKDNVETVRFLGDQLENRIRMLEKKAWGSKPLFVNEKRNTFRRGYFQGAVWGIDKQLKLAKEKAMANNTNVYALVKTSDNQLNDAMQKLFTNLREGRQSRGSSSTMGTTLGFQDGLNMNINKGVEGNKNTLKLK